MDTIARFNSKWFEDENGCWIWKNKPTEKGYGRFGYKGRNCRAHRISYVMFYGPISDEMVVDHLCRVRNCVNPAHLELVTPAENTRRGEVGSNHRNKTHCKRGHEFTDANTYRTRTGHRACRACRKERRGASS